jgi:hypothetical protein
MCRIRSVVMPPGTAQSWNRAVALRRIEAKKDAGTPPNDAGGDGGGGDKNDPNKDKDGGNDNKDKDQNKDKDKDKKDKDKDAGGDNQQPPPKKDPNEPDSGASPPPPSRQNQDDRILDQLENAPTVQQEAAKKHAIKTAKGLGMADK